MFLFRTSSSGQVSNEPIVFATDGGYLATTIKRHQCFLRELLSRSPRIWGGRHQLQCLHCIQLNVLGDKATSGDIGPVDAHTSSVSVNVGFVALTVYSHQNAKKMSTSRSIHNLMTACLSTTLPRKGPAGSGRCRNRRWPSGSCSFQKRATTATTFL